MEELVVIGGGQAAIQCIASLRKEGYSGSITLVGEENHLPYQRPPLSKGYLLNKAKIESLYFKSSTYYENNNVRVIGQLNVLVFKLIFIQRAQWI